MGLARWPNEPAFGRSPMIRRYFASALLVLAIGLSGPRYVATADSPAIVVAATVQISKFESESAAQAHCPKDVVVWLNIPSGVYHYKGERWYGRTKHGAYACEKEAIRAGDRASENGQ